MIIIKGKKSLETLPIDGLDLEEEENQGEPSDQLISISLKEEDPTKTV